MAGLTIPEQEDYFTMLLMAMLKEQDKQILSLTDIAQELKVTNNAVTKKLRNTTGKTYHFFKKTDYMPEGKRLSGNPQTIMPDWEGLALDFIEQHLQTKFGEEVIAIIRKPNGWSPQEIQQLSILVRIATKASIMSELTTIQDIWCAMEESITRRYVFEWDLWKAKQYEEFVLFLEDVATLIRYNSKHSQCAIVMNNVVKEYSASGH